jgi:hypothetical protein
VEDSAAAYPAVDPGPVDSLTVAPGGRGEQRPREQHRQSSWCCF